MEPPIRLDLDKENGLTVEWSEGETVFYPIAYLRKWSPSAEARELRKEMEENPLTVLPSSGSGGSEPLRATGAEMVGNYAIRIHFSDGHHTGLYSWEYLREIDPSNGDSGG